MKYLKFLLLFLISLHFISCRSTILLKNGRTKVPNDFKSVKLKYQKNVFFPLKDLYIIKSNTIGKSDFSINKNSKLEDDKDLFRMYVKFYENGNVNFFYLKDVNSDSFNPEYAGDRGFYDFVGDNTFLIKIYVRTDEWGGKSFETYYGKIEGNKILLRRNQKLTATNDYIIEIFEKLDLKIFQYKSEW